MHLWSLILDHSQNHCCKEFSHFLQKYVPLVENYLQMLKSHLYRYNSMSLFSGVQFVIWSCSTTTRCNPLGLFFQTFKTCCNCAMFWIFPFLTQGLFSEIVALWNSTIIWVHTIVAHSLLCGNFVKVWTLSKFRGVSQVVSQVGELEELKSEKFPPLLAFPLLC